VIKLKRDRYHMPHRPPGTLGFGDYAPIGISLHSAVFVELTKVTNRHTNT